MNLLGQGCGIWIGFYLNVEVDGNYVFKYESENVVPTDGAKLMKRELVSQSGQIELLVGANVSSIGVTGVVSATTPPMPKSE